MSAYILMLITHVGLGVVALLSFWIAALAKKGSAPHKLAGKVYVLVMVGLLIPAAPLAWRVLQQRSLVFGLFLFYLLLITATALRRGWTAVRRKREFAAYADAPFRWLGWLNIAAGAAVLGLGVASSQPILMAFSAVGVLGGNGILKLAQRGPAHPRWWMQEHLGAMLGCGVATHIAFLSIGLPRLLPPAWNGDVLHTTAWLGPLAVAALARAWLGRKYLPAPAARTAPAASANALSLQSRP